MAAHAGATFWFVLPSMPMFLRVQALLNRGIPFWEALAAGSLLTIALYLSMIATWSSATASAWPSIGMANDKNRRTVRLLAQSRHLLMAMVESHAVIDRSPSKRGSARWAATNVSCTKSRASSGSPMQARASR